MATKTIDVGETEAQLSDLLSWAGSGFDVVLTRAGEPLARLVPITSGDQPRVAGLHPDSISTSDDFDAPLPEEFWTNSE